MEQKYTPGPWRLAGHPGGEVANCCNGFGNQDANARFITEAPEMLAALEQIAQLQREAILVVAAETLFLILDNKVGIARAAIAKATGSADG